MLGIANLSTTYPSLKDHGATPPAVKILQLKEMRNIEIVSVDKIGSFIII